MLEVLFTDCSGSLASGYQAWTAVQADTEEDITAAQDTEGVEAEEVGWTTQVGSCKSQGHSCESKPSTREERSGLSKKTGSTGGRSCGHVSGRFNDEKKITGRAPGLGRSTAVSRIPLGYENRFNMEMKKLRFTSSTSLKQANQEVSANHETQSDNDPK